LGSREIARRSSASRTRSTGSAKPREAVAALRRPGGRGRRGGRRRLVRLGAGLHELAQVGENADADDRLGLARLFDLRAQEILGVERDGDEFGARLGLALAHAVEGAFEFVREGRDFLEAEHGARALDGVQGAEGGVDEVAVAGRGFEIERGLFEFLEEFGGLLAEDLGGVGRGAHRISFFTTAMSWSCLNGLVIQAVAPAALASRLMISSDQALGLRQSERPAQREPALGVLLGHVARPASHIGKLNVQVAAVD
jgi:hypothetical protein